MQVSGDPEAVVLTPADADLTSIGETLQLFPELRDGAGNSLPPSDVTWASSDPSVVTVNATGSVTAIANGSTTVTATMLGIQGSAVIRVDQRADRLAFVTQPSRGKARVPFSPAVTVELQDARGNVVPTAAESVNIDIGANSSGGILSGTTTVTSSGGVSVFDDLSIDASGEDYDLVARSGALRAALSDRFDVLVTLTGFGTVAADGVFSAGEWAAADSIPMVIDLPADEGGGTTTATLFVMNDSADLHVGIRLQRSSIGTLTGAFVYLDNDGDGVLEAGDDGFGVNVTNFSPIELRDETLTDQPPCPAGSLCWEPDAGLGGTTDGAVGASNDGTWTYLEMSHPIGGIDGANDITVAFLDVIGFTFEMTLWSAVPGCLNRGSVLACLARTSVPAVLSRPKDYGGILINPGG